MRIGVVFPQTEIGADVGGVRAYGQRVEELGFAHILAYDHVVGADPEHYRPWTGPYDVHTTFHEPFVLFGYLAALTRLELVTGIIILPQRQTVLVGEAGGGGRPAHRGPLPARRGHRLEPRRVRGARHRVHQPRQRMSTSRSHSAPAWTEEAVTHEGEYDRVTAAGLAPLPVQRPIPIWIGGSSPAAYRRMGRLADGWFPQVAPGPDLDAAREIVDQAARQAGRDPAGLGMEGRVSWTEAGLDKLVRQVERWREAGASHLSINTMNAGLGAVDGHLERLDEIAGARELASG